MTKVGVHGVVLGLTLGLLSACSNEDRATAEENLQKWQKNGPKTYAYVLETSCLCATHGLQRVVVTNEVVTSAVDADGNPVTAKTMTALLEEAVQEAGADNDDFQASYDRALGYLERLTVDHTSASDDEYAKTVTCLAEGNRDDVCPL